MVFPGSDPRFESLLQTDLELREKLREQEPQRKLALVLIDLRRRAGLTQKALAERAGWDPAYVSRLESGRGSMPELRTAYRYAEACGGKLEIVASLYEKGSSLEPASPLAKAAQKPDLLQRLFVEHLHDIYYVEQQMLRVLPRMVEAVSRKELSTILEAYLRETHSHIERLEQVFEKLNLTKRNLHSEAAIEGLIAESREIIEMVEDKEVLDVGMISSAQAMEHYQIARYGSLVSYAKQLGYTEVAALLEQTLKEEKMADHELDQIALGSISRAARGSAA